MCEKNDETPRAGIATTFDERWRGSVDTEIKNIVRSVDAIGNGVDEQGKATIALAERTKGTETKIEGIEKDLDKLATRESMRSAHKRIDDVHKGMEAAEKSKTDSEVDSRKDRRKDSTKYGAGSGVIGGIGFVGVIEAIKWIVSLF